MLYCHDVIFVQYLEIVHLKCIYGIMHTLRKEVILHGIFRKRVQRFRKIL